MHNHPLHIKKYEAEGLKNLQIKCSRGDIECYGHDLHEVRIEVYASKLTFASPFEWQRMSKEEFDQLGYRIHRNGETLGIRAQGSETAGLLNIFNFKKVSFRVFLPRNCSCLVETEMGTIRLKGLTGDHYYRAKFGSIYLNDLKGTISSTSKNFGSKVEVTNCQGGLKISSGGSNITINNCNGDHDIHTDGGNIKINDFQGKLVCKTRGGNVTANTFEGEFKAASWGGNIKAYDFKGNMAGNTMGGNVILHSTKIENFAWLETSGGRIELRFPENQGLDITARANQVKSRGNFAYRGSQSRSRWNGQINAGGANVRLKTSGGNIKIIGEPTAFEFPKTGQNPVNEQSGFAQSAQNYEHIKSGGSQQTYVKPRVFNAPKPPQQKRIENLPKLGQALIALFFITLLVYGFNTILFFTSEILNPHSAESESNIAVFYLNLVNGLIAFAATWFYISVFDKRVRRTWGKYIALIVLTYIFYFVTHGALNVLANADHDIGNFWYYYKMMVRSRNDIGNFSFQEAIIFLTVPAFAACAFFAYWNRSRNMNEKLSEQEVQLLNLEKLKTKAQLNALEARINPHFLYNSLNSIAGLIHENPDRAEDMTIELSKLFRATTGRQNESYHSIEEELTLVRSYLEIEQMRFGDRLKYTIDVAQDLLPHRIPRFLLQPLVENAIKHGISKIAKNGEISIKINSQEDQISIEIHDNGPDFGEAISGGYGLKSVQDKLDLIYEGKASLKIVNTPEKKLTILLDKNHAL